MDFDDFLRNNRSKIFSGSDIERDVTAAVSMKMNSLGITKMPVLNFFKKDQGLFERVYDMHMNDQNVELVHRMYGDETYLNLLACHSFGAGAYITLCQLKYGKMVEEFSYNEVNEIFQELLNTDAYELAMNALGFPLDGNNKKCIDQVVFSGMVAYKKAAGKKALDRENLRILMKVLFNAGVTLVLR